MPAGSQQRSLLPRDVRRRGLMALVRTVGITVGLSLIYAFAPMDDAVRDGIPLLVGSLIVLAALLVWHVRAVSRADYPGVRALEALTTSIPFLLLSFAATYFMLEANTPQSFDTPLTRLDAFYFSVTVFATVGFGDITAHSQLARSVVTGQMIVNFVFLAVVVRVLVSAVKVGKQGGGAAYPD